MSQPTNRAVHVDTALTNISVAYMQTASHFIAGQVFPNVPVQKQSDRYFVFDRGSFNRDEAELRAPGTESAGGGYELDNTPTYFANVYAYHHDVPDQVRSNADTVVDPDRAASELVTHKMLIRREKSWASRYFTSGVWGTDITGVAATPTGAQVLQWNDANSDPIGDIRKGRTAMLEQTGFMANTLTLNQHVMDALVDHPDIVDRVKYSGGVGNNNPARVNSQALAGLFEVDRILVSRAIVNGANQGAAEDSSFVFGKNALLTFAPATPSLMQPSAGYTFSWQGYMGQTNAFGFATSRFRMDHLKSDRIEAEMAWDQKVVAADCGYFFDGVVA
jgi:hypothetical protein